MIAVESLTYVGVNPMQEGAAFIPGVEMMAQDFAGLMAIEPARGRVLVMVFHHERARPKNPGWLCADRAGQGLTFHCCLVAALKVQVSQVRVRLRWTGLPPPP